jgi:hypothetical protein
MTIKNKTTDKEAPTYYTDAHAASMMLRDYFAAKAMQAEIVQGVSEQYFPKVAGLAYKMADDMMEARK